MAHILVTGSTAGLGRHTAEVLADAGHRVILHARGADRAEDARRAVPTAAGIVVGDLASLTDTRAVAEAVAQSGPLDAVIHNAGVQETGATARPVTGDGLERTFQVNVLAPYVLTALLPPPRRLVVLTSGLQSQGQPDVTDLQRERRPWDGMQAYADSKLYDVALAFAFARLWPDVATNAVDPGWIRTRMGGPSAPGDLDEGVDTQVWLASSDEPAATASGRYLKQRRELEAHPAASDPAFQDRLLEACAELSGVPVPR